MTTSTATRLEDAVWLLDRGTHPVRVAARLGMTVCALEKMLRAYGHHHQAVNDEAAYQRRQTRKLNR